MDIVERLREGKSAGGYWREKEAADEIDKLREENQRQKEHIMLLNAMIQTEHNIIRVIDLKEGE
jgi:hypothetical protein